MTDLVAAMGLKTLPRLCFQLYDALGDLEELLAHRCQNDIPARADKELHTILRLQGPDLGRDGRLADMQRLCGSGKTTQKCGSVERA